MLRSFKEASALGPLASPDLRRVHATPIRFAHQWSTYAGNTSSIFAPVHPAKTSLDGSPLQQAAPVGSDIMAQHRVFSSNMQKMLEMPLYIIPSPSYTRARAGTHGLLMLFSSLIESGTKEKVHLVILRRWFILGSDAP